MYKSALVRCVRLVALLAVIVAVACVDLSTAPTPPNAGKAVKDSIAAPFDSTECHSGYVVIDGKMQCSDG